MFDNSNGGRKKEFDPISPKFFQHITNMLIVAGLCVYYVSLKKLNSRYLRSTVWLSYSNNNIKNIYRLDPVVSIIVVREGKKL